MLVLYRISGSGGGQYPEHAVQIGSSVGPHFQVPGCTVSHIKVAEAYFVKSVFFWDMSSCNLVVTNVSKQPVASVFRVD